jgi:hypothetical protein
MKLSILLLFSLIIARTGLNSQVTTGSLLEEMISLERLAEFPYPEYRTVQFSSYDRRSISSDRPGWFFNADGFGGEPVPGFEEILEEPGEDGVGRYLICDVSGPGALVRIWTAWIAGNMEVYLDGSENPLYKGPAQEFFYNAYDAIAGSKANYNQEGVFWQNTAGYYPIPFAEGVKIVWEGKLADLHFYHVQVRMYEKGTDVVSFSTADLKKYRKQVDLVKQTLLQPAETLSPEGTKTIFTGTARQEQVIKLGTLKGEKEISYLILKLQAEDMDRALRQTLLTIGFDGASSPQVQSPAGDFFGAAPGINPYHSLPFSVLPDGSMICRFPMPFRDSAQIAIRNTGNSPVHAYAEVYTKPYEWKDDRSMYFRARWRIDHGLHANFDPSQDIPYLLANGKGVCVGAAAYLYNPTSVPSSYGNWWGEGDEKIFIDHNQFPDFFGTGSEDYFNYAWSSSAIFAHAYCGQPRNDGPANRGFVSNYRWHILDNIPFQKGLAFYMELMSHEPVDNFSYGRMVYLYAMQGMYDDHLPVTTEDLRHLELPGNWYPVGRKGSHNASFYQAETLLDGTEDIQLEASNIWSGGKIMVWDPKHSNDKLNLMLPVAEAGKYNIVITTGKDSEGGSFRVKAGDVFLKTGEAELINLNEAYRVLARNYRLAPVELERGLTKLQLIPAEGNNGKIKIDFIWLMKSHQH